MSLNVSKTKLMYISSRHKQQILSNCDHDISTCESNIQAILTKLPGVTISNTLCWDAHIDHIIKKCNSYLFFYLDGTEYCYCDFYTPSSELFKELNWSHILLTYHVEILDLLTVTNYIRQHLKFCELLNVLWSCHLEFSPSTC